MAAFSIFRTRVACNFSVQEEIQNSSDYNYRTQNGYIFQGRFNNSSMSMVAGREKLYINPKFFMLLTQDENSYETYILKKN
jgi:hypothetical protein